MTSSSAGISSPHVVHMSSAVPPRSVQDTAAPKTPPCALTWSASSAAATSSRKKAKMDNDTPCSSILPFHASRNSSNTGHAMGPCTGPLMMWVRIAEVPCAYAVCRLKSIRRYTSSLFHSPSSLAHESSAPASDPDMLRLRSHVCPLSMCVCTSQKVGQHIPPSRSNTRRSSAATDSDGCSSLLPPAAAGTMATIFRSRITMSTKASPSPSTFRSTTAPLTVHSGTCALRSTKSSLMSCHSTLVPSPFFNQLFQRRDILYPYFWPAQKVGKRFYSSSAVLRVLRKTSKSTTSLAMLSVDLR
mmetsp:Transcript_10524/g.25747  ORF Transcript_10524/g.25747 Transcript_10524/m.25747 type:complete len:301 (-) Transcript_10524:35-937(-)